MLISRISVFFQFILLLFLVIFQLIFEGNLYHNKIVLNVILFIDALGIFILFHRKGKTPPLKGQSFRIFPLFVLGFVFVHFQVYIDYVFGFKPWFLHNKYFITSNTSISAPIISSIGLISTFVGYHFFDLTSYSSGVSLKKRKFVNIRTYIVRANFLLLLMVTLLIIFSLSAGESYFNSGYGNVSLGLLARYSQQFFIYTSLAYIICTYIGSTQDKIPLLRLYNPLFWVCMFLYFLLVLMSGDRGPVLVISTVIFSHYILLRGTKVFKFSLFIFIIIASFVISLIGIARTANSSSEFKSQILNENSASEVWNYEESLSPSTLELAKSVRTLHAAVQLREEEGLKYGVFQGWQLIGSVPGVGILIQYFTGIDKRDLRSSGYLTDRMYDGATDHGLGTTVVADIFLDFGVIGVLIMFISFGYLINYIEFKMYNYNTNNIFLITMFFILIANSYYIGRSTLLILLRDSVYVYIMILLSSVFVKRK